MLKYADLSITPPGGRYPATELQTGFRFAEIDFESLLKVIKAHRNANNIPIGVNFRNEIEDASCKELLQMFPDFRGVVDDTGGRAIMPGRKWQLADVQNFLTTVTKFFVGGMKLVSQEEANRRAEICTHCPLNQQMPECLGCQGVTGTIQALRKGKTTPYDENLRICHACGCDLKTKIFLEKDIMEREGVEWAEKCWMRD